MRLFLQKTNFPKKTPATLTGETVNGVLLLETKTVSNFKSPVNLNEKDFRIKETKEVKLKTSDEFHPKNKFSLSLKIFAAAAITFFVISLGIFAIRLFYK